MKTATSPWIAAKITASNRSAKPTTCRSCGAETLTGDDDDRAARHVTVDQQPVPNLVAEVAALLTGLLSYDLIRHDLHHRDKWRAGISTRHPIHIEHRCP